MEYPKSRKALRSVMGVFNQFKWFIKDYSREGSPARTLNSLLSTKKPWTGITQSHKSCIDTLKRTILQGLHLYTPDKNLPLKLETDASNDGWGAVLFQTITGTSGKPERRIIKMWSGQWPPSYLKKPPYYKEAKGWMNGMELTKS